MTTYLPAPEIQERLGLSHEAVRQMIIRAKGAIRTQETRPRLICLEDVQAWRNDAPQRRAASPWHVESREHFDARTAGRKDRQMNGATVEGAVR